MESGEFLPSVIGHSLQRQYLSSLVSLGRVPNALLFVGNVSVGKYKTAFEFAKALLCRGDNENGPCGQCASCIQADKGFNPDLFVLDEEKEIKVEHIREQLSEFLSKKPLSGSRKVVIINDSDKMNDTAANALLKNLEEPPKDCVFILVSSNEDMLLPTIFSRCQVLRFGPLSKDDILKISSNKKEDVRFMEGSLRPIVSKKGLKAAALFAEGKNKIFSRQNAEEEFLGIGILMRESMLLALNADDIMYNVFEKVPNVRLDWEFWEWVDMYFSAQSRLGNINLETIRFAMQMKARQVYD